MDGPSGDIYLRAHGMGATKRQHQHKKKKNFGRHKRLAECIDDRYKDRKEISRGAQTAQKMEKKIDGQQRNGNEVYDCKRRRNLLISLSLVGGSGARGRAKIRPSAAFR